MTGGSFFIRAGRRKIVFAFLLTTEPKTL